MSDLGNIGDNRLALWQHKYKYFVETQLSSDLLNRRQSLFNVVHFQSGCCALRKVHPLNVKVFIVHWLMKEQKADLAHSCVWKCKSHILHVVKYLKFEFLYTLAPIPFKRYIPFLLCHLQLVIQCKLKLACKFEPKKIERQNLIRKTTACQSFLTLQLLCMLEKCERV